MSKKIGLTRPIPKTALPVVLVLRQEVPRPKRKPKQGKWFKSLVWQKPNGNTCCAMGLLPGADQFPTERDGFDGRASTRAVRCFGKWFDAQRDPQAIVDAIWGTAGS